MGGKVAVASQACTIRRWNQSITSEQTRSIDFAISFMCTSKTPKQSQVTRRQGFHYWNGGPSWCLGPAAIDIRFHQILVLNTESLNCLAILLIISLLPKYHRSLQGPSCARGFVQRGGIRAPCAGRWAFDSTGDGEGETGETERNGRQGGNRCLCCGGCHARSSVPDSFTCKFHFFICAYAATTKAEWCRHWRRLLREITARRSEY